MVATGCGSHARTAAQARPETPPRTIRVALSDFRWPLDPALASTRDETTLARAIYSTPLRTDTSEHVVAGLCTAWNAGNGFRIWTFHCRHAVEIAAELRRAGRLRASPAFWIFSSATSVTVPAPGRLVVRLEFPWRRFPYALTAVAAAPRGVPGPFRLVSGSPARVVLRAAGRTLVFVHLSRIDAARAFFRGKLDEAPVPLGDVGRFRSSRELRVRPLLALDAVVFTRPVPLDVRRALWQTADRADYQALVDEVFPTALALVPDGVAILDARFTPVPIWSQHAAQGREYRLQAPRTALQGQMTRLAVGDSAISLTFGVGQVVNVAFAECQVALAWDDGSRTLISRDSFRLHIRPADWTGGAEMLKALDARLPKNRVVPMGPRPNPDPESLSGAMAPAARPTRKRWTFNWRRAVIAGTMLIAFYVLAAILRVALGGH